MSCQGIPAIAVKKLWAGKSRASLEDMLGAAELRGFEAKGEADAGALAAAFAEWEEFG